MEATLEDLVRMHKEKSFKIQELELEKKALGVLILRQMTGKKLDVSDYTVRRYGKLSIKLTLEQARLYDAVKMEEIIDRDRIKELHEKGEKIEGVSEIEYITVSSNKEKLCGSLESLD
jgi:hypothetical protein